MWEQKKLVLGKPEMQLSVKELQLERELSSLSAWRWGCLYNSGCKGVSFYCGRKHRIWANRLANYPWFWNKLPRWERMLASVPHSNCSVIQIHVEQFPGLRMSHNWRIKFGVGFCTGETEPQPQGGHLKYLSIHLATLVALEAQNS